MTEHKFLTPRLGAIFLITKMGLAASSPLGWLLMLLLQPLLNWMANMGLGFVNLVVIEWLQAKDKEEFDKLQELGLNKEYVASLSDVEREEKSNAFKAAFKKFVGFSFLKSRK